MPTDDSLRARLEALNRGPLPPSPVRVRDSMPPPISEAAKRVVSSFRLPRNSGELPSTTTTAAIGACPIAGILRRGEVIETSAGPHLQINLPLEQLWPGGTNLVQARQQFLLEQLAVANAAVDPNLVLHPEFAAFIGALPDRTLALDLETCGLAGAALFLIGVLRRCENTPTVQLLLARNYSEEAAVLAALWEIVAEHDVLLTFNGKTFDWPMVIERSIRHRLRFEQPVGWAPPTKVRTAKQSAVGNSHPGSAKVHIDILHHARQRWRRQLPNCRLLTLENHVCRRTRSADIPGHAIPGVYAEYVRTGFEREMDTVLYHNALDLVTLFDLAHRLAA
jgi:uncharacterized protein YprB with RNaseH-like and TPR domain